MKDLYWETNGLRVYYSDVIKYSNIAIIDTMILKPFIISTIDEDRVSNADITYPILILVDGSRIVSILDGNHRVIKALKSSIDSIRAYTVDINSCEDIFKIFK